MNYKPRNIGLEIILSLFGLVKKILKMKLIIIVIMLGLMSCKKDKHEKCYHCEFGPLNGQNPPPKDYCGTPPEGFFQDAQGNDYSYNCEEIH